MEIPLTNDQLKIFTENQLLALRLVRTLYRKNGTIRYLVKAREDAEQIAYVALAHAIQGFKSELNVKFSTFLCRCIYNSLTHYSHNFIRPSEKGMRDIIRINSGRDPIYNCSNEKMQASFRAISIKNFQVFDDGTMFEPADGNGSVVENIFRQEEIGVVKRILEKIPYEYKKILWLRYGLGGERSHTLMELGRVFGISKEAARLRICKGMRLFRVQYKKERENVRLSKV